MVQLAKIKLAGNELLAEVHDRVGDSDARALTTPKEGGRALDATESLNTAIRGFCVGLERAFHAIDSRVRPNKVTVNFGLTLTGDLNFALATSGTEASLTVEVEWMFNEE